MRGVKKTFIIIFMKIMANNLKRQYELYAAEFDQKALDVIHSGWYVLGEEVSAFEREFADWIGSGYCVGLGSGLDALWISFRLLGIGPGDEVIVSSNAYIACVMGITMNGATPVFVDSDQYNNIDASLIEAAVTPRTKAILAVHLFGTLHALDGVTHVHDILFHALVLFSVLGVHHAIVILMLVQEGLRLVPQFSALLAHFKNLTQNSVLLIFLPRWA